MSEDGTSDGSRGIARLVTLISLIFLWVRGEWHRLVALITQMGLWWVAKVGKDDSMDAKTQ
jgi:hypothetical protein